MNFLGFRKETNDLFQLTEMRNVAPLNHTPFIVVTPEELRIIKSAKQLLDEYTDWVPVIFQWPGKYKSDYFQFTVGDLRKYIKEHPPTSGQLV